MKKKNVLIVSIALIFLILSLETRFIINMSFAKKYDDGNAEEWKVQFLSFLNFYQMYIAPKNYGDYYYQSGDYEKAVEKYDKALNRFPPKRKACDIRINASLAILKMVNLNDKEMAKSLLMKAQKYVKNDDCLTLSFLNQQEKNDAKKIDSEIEQKLKEIEGSSQNGGDGTEEDEKDDNNRAGIENPKIQEIKESNQSAQEARDEGLGRYQDEYDPSYKGKPW